MKLSTKLSIVGLKMAATIGIMELEVPCDSLLIVNQINKEYITKDDQMVAYLKIITTWKSKFSRCNFIQVRRSENSYVDSLTTLASAIDFQFRHEIRIKYFSKPSICKFDEEILHLDTSSGWRGPIIAYLKDGTHSVDKAEARKLQHLATSYILGDLLYKKSYFKLHSDPYLRCLDP